MFRLQVFSPWLVSPLAYGRGPDYWLLCPHNDSRSLTYSSRPYAAAARQRV